MRPPHVVAWLRDIDPGVSWPAPSTAGAILGAGLVQRRRRRRRASPWSEPFAHAIVPNDVWCIDFKGWFRPATGHASIPSPCKGAGAPHRPGDAARVSAGRPPPGSGPTTRSAWAPLTPLRPSPSAFRDTPERASRAPPPHPQDSANGDGGEHRRLQQRATPRGPGTAGRLYTPSGPIPHASAPDYGAEVAPSAPNGEIKWKGDRVYVSAPSGRAHRPRPATSAPGRYSAPSSLASSTTTRAGSTRPRYTCYLCPRSSYPCARSHTGEAGAARPC